nr:LysR family transcriptional regulator [uncultured Rhodococcus sp.]
MIDVHRLRVFRAVVADGSIAGAASGLGYTPSAISQHLTALQRETGLVLLEKKGRGLVPTTAGRILADRSSLVFDRIADLDALVGDLRNGRVGTLAISYFASAGAAWVPPIVASLTREFPRLRLDLRLIELRDESSSPPDVEIYVEGAESTNLTGYQSFRLLSEPYFAVVPLTNHLADRTSVELLELRDEEWVDNDVARGPCRKVVLDACAAAGFTPCFGVETHDYPTAIRFVAEGVGITVLPGLGLDVLPDSVIAVPITNPTPSRHISVRVRDVIADNPAVVRMVDLLRLRVNGPTPIEIGP